MTKSVNTRELVLDILMEVTAHDGYSHLVIRQMLKKHQYLEKQDRAFISRLAEGTIEQAIQLDYIINQFSKVKTHKMKLLILNILRMSVYQMKFMDSVPDSASCNEAVKLAVKRGFGNLRGFVNGVLRNIGRNIDQINFPKREEDMLSFLSIQYSMPIWILEIWLKSYDAETVEIILLEFLKNKKTTVRCNTSLASKDEIKRILQEDGVTVQDCPYIEDAVYISEYDYIDNIKAFKKGLIQIQDLSSMLVAEVASPQKGEYIIDVCAAPGGKSIQIADLLNATGHVEARDLTETKVDLILESIKRTNLTNISATVVDATQLDEDSVEKADIVIADLPCSGLGVIGKKTDLKYKISEDKLEELVSLQRQILETVQLYVKPNGILIYSTCTINQNENEDNVNWFLERFPYKLESINNTISEELQGETTSKGYLQLLPGIHKTDGFFIAKLRKEAK